MPEKADKAPDRSREVFAVGRLGAPKGVHGDLKLQSYSGESAHFRKLAEVELRSVDPASDDAATGTATTLKLKGTSIQGEGNFLTIAFAGYTSPETARVLTGMEIIVPRAAAAPLKANEWYIEDLTGLVLVDASDSPTKGRELARVRSVLEGGADPCLEAVLPGGRSALVPFRKEFVGEVDVAGGRIELLAPWLLDE